MDQSALLLMLVVAMTAANPDTGPHLVEKIVDKSVKSTPPERISCWTVEGEKPRLADIPLKAPRYEISSNDKPMLRDLAAFMREHDCSVRVWGYSDESGSTQQKMRASDARAKAVHDFLTAEQVKKELMQVEGKGELETPGWSKDQKKIARVVL